MSIPETDQRNVNLLPNYSYIRRAATIFSGLVIICLHTQCNDSKAARQSDPANIFIAKDTVKTEEEAEKPLLLDSAKFLQLYNQLSRNRPEHPWPVEPIYPKPGALLPFNRIVAFYGNLYSTRMGILGALPPDEMLEKLGKEVRSWQAADTTTKVIPALHYIAVTAQRDPGQMKKYRLRMPDKEIHKVLDMAKRIDAKVFLDIQVGHSTLQEEIPLLKEFLMMPDVHLGIDPEYSMKSGDVPGHKVGTFYAEDINYAIEYLAELVREYDLPPKVLIVHRFKKSMVTNYQQIKRVPEVQVVINMDGFGSKAKKQTTYRQSVTQEPVQYSGYKIFYKNDAMNGDISTIMQPGEVLSLHPVPVYIQYQ
jgi:hypothetical protein